MSKKITYYDILGIEREANIDDIKKAYRMLAKADHPDINGSSRSVNKRMALLNKAHETLIDPVARREYDEQIDDIDQQINTKVYDEKDENGYQGEKVVQKNGSWWTGIFIILIIFGYQIFLQMNNNSNHTASPAKTSPTTEYSVGTNKSFTYPTITSEPTVDCTGPDGKHLYITQKACDDFNNAWKATPTEKPYGGNSCGVNSHLSSGFCVCDNGYKRNHNIGVCE